MSAGLGYGGSCFPKDVKASCAIADHVGVDFQMLKKVGRSVHEEMEHEGALAVAT